METNDYDDSINEFVNVLILPMRNGNPERLNLKLEPLEKFLSYL